MQPTPVKPTTPVKPITVDTSKLVLGIWRTVAGPYYSLQLDSNKTFSEDWTNVNYGTFAGDYRINKDSLIFTVGSGQTAEHDNCTIIKINADSLVFLSHTSGVTYREFRFVPPVSPYSITTLAGNGYPYLLSPASVTQDSNGNLYVVNNRAYQIQIITPDKKISDFISFNTSSQHYFASMGFPSAVYIYPGDDNLYFADAGDVFKFSLSKQTFIKLANLPVNNAAIQSIIADKSGNVYVADPGSDFVFKIDASSGKVTAVAGNGTDYPFNSSPGIAANAAILPWEVAFGANNELYICDAGGNCIWKLDLASGAIALFAGNGTKGFSGDGGLASSAELVTPFGIAADAAGNVYIADNGNTRLRKVDPQGNISTIAGRDYGIFEDTVDADASNVAPADLYINAAGDILLCDSKNYSVRKVFKR